MKKLDTKKIVKYAGALLLSSTLISSCKDISEDDLVQFESSVTTEYYEENDGKLMEDEAFNIFIETFTKDVTSDNIESEKIYVCNYNNAGTFSVKFNAENNMDFYYLGYSYENEYDKISVYYCPYLRTAKIYSGEFILETVTIPENMNSIIIKQMMVDAKDNNIIPLDIINHILDISKGKNTLEEKQYNKQLS